MTESTIELFLVRHAESAMSAQMGIPRSEAPLTPRGIQQARRLGRHLLGQDIVPTRVYASPDVRTLQSARHSLEAMGLDIGITVDEALQGPRIGGRPGSLGNETCSDPLPANVPSVVHDIESTDEVSARMMEWANSNVLSRAGSGSVQRILAYSHRVAIRCFVGTICGWTQSQADAARVDNGSLTLLSSDGGPLRLEYFSRTPS